MLTTFDSDDLVLGTLRARSTQGFVLKDTQPYEILDAVRTVAEVRPCCPRRATARMQSSAR